MMGGGADGQGQIFYSFELDEVVPPDHLVRQIDAVLDLSWVHKELAPYYSHTGRPSIDPVLMIRMLIVGYVFAIRSERRLCSEVQVNLAYRWFCKLGIEDGIPDHSFFSRARHICPKGKLLHTTGTVIDGHTLRYRASKRDCDVCAFKMQCCPHAPSRWIPRDFHEDARDVARALAKTEAFEQSRRERKKVEMCFAHMKRIFKLDRLRLRGPSGAKDEVLLTATAQAAPRQVPLPP